MEGTSLCIVTLDRPKQLAQQVKAIRDHATGTYEIIIVDNGSGQRGQALLDEFEADGVMVIRNEENLGLSVATNQGLEAGQYDTLVHLDDDALITSPGWNQIMRDYLMREEIGLVKPTSSPHSIQHDDYQEITWGLGICWAIGKELFGKIGGYDPRLYHQNECDMDLRVRMSGLQVAAIQNFVVKHNDGGGPRSDMSFAREHIGVVQFRDKWCKYFRGENWNYGTEPLYLMQHWPPDQDFWNRYALSNGVNLNPAPEEYPSEVALREVHAREVFDQYVDDSRQKIVINGVKWLVWRDIRNDYTHWSWQANPDGYMRDREKAIARWYELTGELYEGYEWPVGHLKP
jgi:glycosyltransferase involved in cell wall biosynthesis